MLSNIAQIAIVVADIQRATAFYRDVLQLPYLFSIPNAAFFQCGEVRLYLVETPSQAGFAGTSCLYYRVADISAEFARLQAANVAVVDTPHLVAQMPGYDLWMAFLKDSEENTLALLAEIPTSA